MADPKTRSRNATALLKEDHRWFKKLFAAYEQIEKGEKDPKAEIFQDLRRGLTVHAQIEEEVFYPAIQNARDEINAPRLVREAHEEHRLVRMLLEELGAMTPGDDEFDAKFKVLKDNVLHHAEEEQDEIFPIFKRLSKDVRDQVAELLASRKQELAPEG